MQGKDSDCFMATHRKWQSKENSRDFTSWGCPKSSRLLTELRMWRGRAKGGAPPASSVPGHTDLPLIPILTSQCCPWSKALNSQESSCRLVPPSLPSPTFQISFQQSQQRICKQLLILEVIPSSPSDSSKCFKLSNWCYPHEDFEITVIVQDVTGTCKLQVMVLSCQNHLNSSPCHQTLAPGTGNSFHCIYCSLMV